MPHFPNFKACVFDAYGTLFDVHAAVGLRVAWINRFGQRPERLPGTPDAELSSLTDLPALLEA